MARAAFRELCVASNVANVNKQLSRPNDPEERAKCACAYMLQPKLLQCKRSRRVVQVQATELVGSTRDRWVETCRPGHKANAMCYYSTISSPLALSTPLNTCYRDGITCRKVLLRKNLTQIINCKRRKDFACFIATGHAKYIFILLKRKP